MGKRRRANKIRHKYLPQLSWDESAYFCSWCSQYEDSWQHTPKVPWYKFWRS